MAIIECRMCKSNVSHGGKCLMNDKNRCLHFEKDPRGTIEFTYDRTMVFDTSQGFPKLNEWNDDWEVDASPGAPMKFTKITPIRWITNRMVGVECNASYYYFDNSTVKNNGKLAEVIPLRKKGTE